ncbi:hypothetical protein [Subtercola sp. YIM 133946]|uniref:hypothetical protein n=1 Tax=Subtercola sp. YIM 133946 TaxID=3118909 RepID=UPI002F94F52B
MTSTLLIASTELDRRTRVIVGAAGLIAIALIVVTISQSTTPDVTVPGAAKEVASWLSDSSTGSGARIGLAASAISYLPMIIFMGGLCRVVAEWARSPLWKTVAVVAAALFLAGAVGGDAMAMSVPLVVGSNTDIHISAEIVAFADRAWLISYVEAHVALATLAAITTIAGWIARRRGATVPLVVLLLGALGALAVIPLVLFPTTFAVFLVSNQLRLLWLVVTAVWLILRRSSLTAVVAESALTEP